MVTLGKFISAFMNGLAKGRSKADHTSYQVSQAYLGHDFLRGFPVPRMTIKNVELEVSFAVGPATRFDHLLGEPEVVAHVLNRLREDFRELRNSNSFQQLLGHASVSDAQWSAELDTLFASMQRILGMPQADPATLVHTLSIAIENFFHRLQQRDSGGGLLSELKQFFSSTTTASETKDNGAGLTVRNWATQHVKDALAAGLPPGELQFGEDGKLGDDDELVILVGSDLEGKGSHLIHKAKLSFASEDRKWVSSGEKEGEKVYTLGRH